MRVNIPGCPARVPGRFSRARPGDDQQYGGYALEILASVAALAERAHQTLQRKVGGAAGQGIVADIDEPARLG